MAPLTQHQIDVLKAVAVGKNNRQIGRQMGISAFTVKNLVVKLKTKFAASTRTELVWKSMAAGVIVPPDVKPAEQQYGPRVVRLLSTLPKQSGHRMGR